MKRRASLLLGMLLSTGLVVAEDDNTPQDPKPQSCLVSRMVSCVSATAQSGYDLATGSVRQAYDFGKKRPFSALWIAGSSTYTVYAIAKALMAPSEPTKRCRFDDCLSYDDCSYNNDQEEVCLNCTFNSQE